MTTPDSAPPSVAETPEKPPAAKRSKWRRRFRKLGILALVFLVMGAMGLGGAEYYTSRPDFCGTCHIMDPYYLSWTHDKHSGKNDVWCVECHYAPGEQHTPMAKFKGLSQLTSYFSGRSGASRPRAHVSDASCMRSECHGKGEHMDKKILIGKPRMEKRLVEGLEVEVQRTPTVWFDHAKHLRVEDRLAQAEAAIDQITKRLTGSLTSEALAAVRRAATSVQPAAARQAEMAALVKGSGGDAVAADATELMRLEHERLRLLQLESITCATCHGYDASGQRHFAVDQQSCFVCHFTNQAFNQETGACLKCHAAPTRAIAVHGGPAVPASGASAASAPAGATLMDHQDIVKRGINCESCHADVVRGDAAVNVAECAHCHDQKRFTEGFEQRTTQTVADYHRVHVAGQRARCPDCHKAVEHSLVDAAHVGTSADLLRPVLDDCQHCHSGHHREQVEILMGKGGQGVDRAMPNAMFGSRLNCKACHTQTGSDFKGDPLVEASRNTCVACHSEDYRKLFDQWQSEIGHSVQEVEQALARVDAQLAAAAKAGRPASEDVRERVERARANLKFVRAANGIHNKNYSLLLLDNSLRDLDAVLAALTTP